MKKNNLIKIIIGSTLVFVIALVSIVNFSNNKAEATTYKVNVGSKSVYVRTAHGSAYARTKAQNAFSSGRLSSSCRNVSYSCHWCSPAAPPPPVDVCPNLPGNQGKVPDNYKKVDGKCLPDMCLNITGFQQTVPDGFVDVGGKICQIGSSFFISCSASDMVIAPNEEANFIATPFNHSGKITYKWYEGSNTSGSPLATQQSEDRVFFKKQFSDQGNKIVTVVATDATGVAKQKACGVMVTTDGSDEDDDKKKNKDKDGIDLNNDGILDLTKNGDLLDKDAAVQLAIDRILTNTTCKITWTSTNTLECVLTNTEGLTEKIELNGSKDVPPGQYSVRCFTPSLRIITSDPVTCRLNPDIREI